MSAGWRRWWPDAVVVSLAATAIVLASEGGPQVLRTPVIGGLLLCGPGFALARATGLDEPVVRSISTIGVSLAAATAVATAQLYAGAWDPSRAVEVLAIATVLLSLVSARRRRPTDLGDRRA